MFAAFDKLNVALGGEEGKATKDLLTKESLKILWKELGKEITEKNKTGVEKQGSWLVLLVLLFGVICLLRTFLFVWNFICKCWKRAP